MCKEMYCTNLTVRLLIIKEQIFIFQYSLADQKSPDVLFYYFLGL